LVAILATLKVVRRSIYVLLAAVAASAIGYGISALFSGSSSPSAPRFSFAQSKLRGSPRYEIQDGEMALLTYCPLLSGVTAITVAQEKAKGCDLLPGGRFSALLASPIGAASSPSQVDQAHR